MIAERDIRFDRLKRIADFTLLAGKYECDIKVMGHQSIVDGKSLMGVISLVPYQPLKVVANGNDAQDFIGQLDKIAKRTYQ